MAAPDRLLVLGGSGILAPLAREAADEGSPVLAVGRRAGRLAELADPAEPGLQTLAADAREPAGATTIANAGPYGAAALYGPATDPATLPALLGAVAGRAVLVLTSAVADPGTGTPVDELAARLRPRDGDAVLVLGWRPPDGATAARWHTAGEVSDAALAVLRDGRDATLGTLRPWPERPA